MGSIDQQVVRCGGMVDVAPVDAVDDQTPREPKPGHYLHGVFVNPVCHEIFCQRAVVAVCHLFIRLGRVPFFLGTTPVVQVLNVDKVDVSILIASARVPWDQAAENFLSEKCGADFQIVLVVVVRL